MYLLSPTLQKKNVYAHVLPSAKNMCQLQIKGLVFKGG